MIELIDAPDHVVAMKLSGTLTGEDYDAVIREVEAKLGRHAKIGVLVDLCEFTDVTAEAALDDLRYGFSKLFQLSRFPREALITDKHWMKVVARVVSPLIPFVEVRAFPSAERDAAMAWVSGMGG